jgi:hypothetical protein
MLSKSNFGRGYVDLRKNIVRQLTKAKMQHQIFEKIQNSLDAVLAEDSIVLSRTERKRLLAQVTQDVLGDMLQKLESTSAGKKQG